jgi:hypothetical protein
MRSEHAKDELLACQRRKLSLWLEEWQIYKALAAVGSGDWTAMAPRSDAALVTGGEWRRGSKERAKGQQRRTGQIRLLCPCRIGLAHIRPVYAVLLRKQNGPAWLVAPFSRFVNPAVPGEWGTGIRAAPLRVLCLWNARVVADETMESAWLSGKMTDAQVANALDLWRHLVEAKPMEQVLARRTGPPLKHPLDPRHEYLQEERELLDEHVGFAFAQEPQGSTLVYEVPQSALRKAAEERGKYGKEKKD